MKPTPPEFAAAGLDHTTQLYQLNLHVGRLRRTVQRLWACTGMLVLVAGATAVYGHWIPAYELTCRSLVLDAAGARSFAVQPRPEGLGIEVSDAGDAVVSNLLLRTQGSQISLEKDGKPVWTGP